MSYVLNTLGVFNGLAPPYTSLVMFELLYMLGWKVRISYRNDTTLDPYVLTIPGCHELLPPRDLIFTEQIQTPFSNKIR